jgi:HEAT repeat protein
MSRGSSLGSIAILLGLCALPAQGQRAEIAPQVKYALTSIDTPPTKQDLEFILESPDNELSVLRQYANGTDVDFGVRLRATRAIPQFCAEQMGCRDAIIAVFNDITATDSSTPRGQQLLRKRAAIEALAAVRSGHPDDVPLLLGFLRDPSRDIRVAAARALRDLCDPDAIGALQQQRAMERVVQVRKTIDEALEAIAQCGP